MRPGSCGDRGRTAYKRDTLTLSFAGEWVEPRSPWHVQDTVITTITAIEELIRPTLDALGFEVVVVRVHGGTRPRLQIMAEPCDRERGMTVEDCADISHAVSALLDVAEPIKGGYTLEVSSPGIDRPLARPEHFLRFKGERAKVETEMPIEGRRKFVGRIAEVSADEVALAVPTPEGEITYRLPMQGLKKAKLAIDEPPPSPPGRRPPAKKSKGSKADGA